jgi:hypothetical protein
LQRLRSHRSGTGHRLMFLRMPRVNRQGQAHIVSTAIVSPGSGKGGREVEATPGFRTWFSIDPQPASISPTINISIVFICAFLVDCRRTIRRPAIKNDSSAILGARNGHPSCHQSVIQTASSDPFHYGKWACTVQESNLQPSD